MPPSVNSDTWPALICQDEREKAFMTAAENGAAAAQPNLHQRAPCQAETIPILVKYPKAQCYKKLPIIHPNTQEDGVTTQPIPQKKFDATNRLLEGALCPAFTNRNRQAARRLVCWSCKAQYRLNCMMSHRTQIVRTQATQRWQCTHCSQKPVEKLSGKSNGPSVR